MKGSFKEPFTAPASQVWFATKQGHSVVYLTRATTPAQPTIRIFFCEKVYKISTTTSTYQWYNPAYYVALERTRMLQKRT